MSGANPVTPSRIMLEVRRAVEAELIASAQNSTAAPDAASPMAQTFYAAARQALPI